MQSSSDSIGALALLANNGQSTGVPNFNTNFGNMPIAQVSPNNGVNLQFAQKLNQLGLPPELINLLSNSQFIPDAMKQQLSNDPQLTQEELLRILFHWLNALQLPDEQSSAGLPELQSAVGGASPGASQPLPSNYGYRDDGGYDRNYTQPPPPEGTVRQVPVKPGENEQASSDVAERIAKAAEAEPQGDGRHCAKGVGNIMERAGMKVQRGHAREWDTYLRNSGQFEQLPPGTAPKRGDILVHEASGGHPWGHVAVYLGDGKEMSDRRRNLITGKNYGGTTIWRAKNQGTAA